MFSKFAKFILVATSLSPVLGAIFVSKLERGKPFLEWFPWLFVALCLVVVCFLLLKYAQKNAQQHLLHVKEFENNDKEVLAFLLAYLLPFISPENMAFEGHCLTGIYILAIIFIVVAHSGALHFNPVMGLLNYHFYEVKNDEGVSVLLISRQEYRRPDFEVQTVRLAHNIYLQKEERKYA